MKKILFEFEQILQIFMKNFYVKGKIKTENLYINLVKNMNFVLDVIQKQLIVNLWQLEILLFKFF